MYYHLLIFLVPIVTGYYYKPKISDQPSQEAMVIKGGEEPSCKCMPYYLCYMNFNAVKDNTNSPNGQYGTLDLRSNFFTDLTSMSQMYPCQDRMEMCCKQAKIIVDPSKPKLPELKSCGYRNTEGLDFNLVRVTGKETLFGEFPWVVAILDKENIYYGAGSLIHPRVVITAAHIVTGHALENLKIRAGEWDTMTIKERLRHQEQLVKEVYVHQEFVNPTSGNDIALLLLEQPIQLDEHINVICMPDQDEDFSQYKNCVANGWGKSSFGSQSQYAEVLKKVEIDMVERTRCQNLLSRRTHRIINLHPSFVCAGGEEGKDTCQGDGGAPLACPVGNDRYKLTGLVVAGIRCGLKDVPAVYTDVAKYRRWVDNKMAAWGLESNVYNV